MIIMRLEEKRFSHKIVRSEIKDNYGWGLLEGGNGVLNSIKHQAQIIGEVRKKEGVNETENKNWERSREGEWREKDN